MQIDVNQSGMDAALIALADTEQFIVPARVIEDGFDTNSFRGRQKLNHTSNDPLDNLTIGL